MKKNYVFFVGIDISARTFDVVMGCNEKGKKHFCFTNNAKGISELLTTINRLHSNQHEVLICCEHTGVYMDKLTYTLQSTDIDLWVVHPLLLSNYSIELNRFKSDKADAKKIFLYAITHCSRAVAYQRHSTDVQTLKDLFMLRKQMLRDRTAWQCRIHAASQKAIPNALELALHNELITLLGKFIKQIDNAIKQLIRSSAHIKELYAILISIPGIGPVIAHHMLLLTDCFTRFTSWKAFACFVGTTAYGKQSGTTLKKKARTSKQAHRKLKADLNQGVLSICTHNPLFQLVYQQLEQKRIPHLQILNNIKNVLIKLAFTLVNKRTKYDEQLFFQNKKSWQNILVLS